MTTIIHINRNIIQRNNKRDESKPVVRVEQGRDITYCMEAVSYTHLTLPTSDLV